MVVPSIVVVDGDDRESREEKKIFVHDCWLFVIGKGGKKLENKCATKYDICCP